MELKAILFGGMGTLAECAELDRSSWNAAFRAHGLNWDWSWDSYCELMRHGGDRQLAARFAEFLGVRVDAARLDATHIRLFAARLADGIPLRSGVAEVLTWAARQGFRMAMVSRAEAPVVHALLAATARARGGIEFDALVTRREVGRLAPHPDAMRAALDRLSVTAAEAVAVTDTPATAAAALDAGIATIGWPGLLAEEQVFPEGAETGAVLTPERVACAFSGLPQEAAE